MVSFMAKTTVINSDISGAASAKTVTFGWDGKSFEIDLTEKEKTELAKTLKRYLEAARPAPKGTNTTGPARSGRRAVGPAPAVVRAWARANKVKVPDRGRIPEAVMEKYLAANGK